MDLDFERIARDLVGIQYRDYGRDAITGVDCFGLVMLFYRSVGITTFDNIRILYEMRISNLEYIAMVAKSLYIPIATLEKTGNLIAFEYDGLNDSHLGVRLDNDRFLHIIKDWGATINNITVPWQRRIVAEYDVIRA